MKQVWSAKFLGVYLDEHLTLSHHIETDLGKVSKTCDIFNKLKYRLPRGILLNFYYSYFTLSAILCSIWANCNHSKLNSFHIIQKRAMKNICKLNYYPHTAPCFRNLQIPALFDIYIAYYRYPILCLKLHLICCRLSLQNIFKLIPLFKHLQDYHMGSSTFLSVW